MKPLTTPLSQNDSLLNYFRTEIKISRQFDVFGLFVSSTV